MSNDSLICPLCATPGATTFHEGEGRRYCRCRTCRLAFVPSGMFLSSEQEKERYDLHENSSNDPGYRQFLSHLFVRMRERLEPGSLGLDFGSGPGPTLSLMFKEAGFPMEIYDYFYAEEPRMLVGSYDFITASEVVEHLRKPRTELDRLWSILKPGGWLGIMTSLLPDSQPFATWYYKNDATHVCFFSRATFEWLAARWQAEMVFFEQNVVLLRKRM